MNDALTISGWLIGAVGTFLGIISFGYAVYSDQRRKRLTDLIRANNWHIFQKASSANGHVQHAMKLYVQSNPSSSPIEFIKTLGMADAFGQSVFLDSIHQIQLHEPSFSERDIDLWVKQGKISPEHATVFRKFIVSSAPVNNGSEKPRPIS